MLSKSKRIFMSKESKTNQIYSVVIQNILSILEFEDCIFIKEKQKLGCFQIVATVNIYTSTV